jgi:hypothetical protein
MSASALLANLFINGGEMGVPEPREGELVPDYEFNKFKVLKLTAFLDFIARRSVSPPMVGRTPSPRPTTPEIPLFDVDPFSPVVEQAPLTVQDFPSPAPLPLPVDETDDEELQAEEEEVRQEFQWLADILRENQRRGWGTAYRDFADVLLLLEAGRRLGMAEMGNGRISGGQFLASTGYFSFNLSRFIDIMCLEHTPATWGNKLTAYFRVKSLYLYSQHNPGISFANRAHQTAWSVVKEWMEKRDQLLAEDWVTTRYGNKELRPLLRDMVAEVNHGECLLSLGPVYKTHNADSGMYKKVG